MLRAALVLLFSVVMAASVYAADASLLRHEASALASLGLRYGAEWTPPGEAQAWRLDCSNAARYLVRRIKGIDLPRTASDQYLYIRSRGRLKRVGGIFGGIPDERWWAKRLQPGDLIFWEHTYKPKRQPPVTHVMVYLGRGADGRLLMAGAQNSRGVDIYKFQPRVPYGGHGGFLGLFKKKGRVVAFGRLAEPRG
jgi:cell wall-associated NlpC family hydrolase